MQKKVQFGLWADHWLMRQCFNFWHIFPRASRFANRKIGPNPDDR